MAAVAATGSTSSRSRRGPSADYAATLERVLRDRPIDVAFLAMAVSDFEPEPVAGKLDSEAEALVIRGRRTPKVIRSVRDWSPDVYLVGFKLLSRADRAELIRQAEAACRTNRADLTVANDLQPPGRPAHRPPRPPRPAPETLGPDDGLADRLVERVFAWAAARGEGHDGRKPDPTRWRGNGLLPARAAPWPHSGPTSDSLHRLHHGDSLLPVLVSLQRLDAVLLGAGSLRDADPPAGPARHASVREPAVQGFLNVFCGLSAFFLLPRYLLQASSPPSSGP